MTRILAILVGVAMVLGALAIATPSVAHAAGDEVAPSGAMKVPAKSPHGDIIEAATPRGGNGKHEAPTKPGSKGMALLFWVFAASTIGGALFVVTRRNLIAAVMGMVGSFIGISAVYMMLYASFLSVVQMLVYAGAIMVLFVFVVMILNRPEDEPVAPSGRLGQALGGLAMVYLIGRLVMVLVEVKVPSQASFNAPSPVVAGGKSYDWGSIKAVGADLFGPGLFPFEAISILLLVGVVGAIAIARPMHEDAKSEAGTP